MHSSVILTRSVLYLLILYSSLDHYLPNSQVNAPKVQYDYFDFHRECKNMRWDRIDLLLNRIKDDLVDKAYVVSSNHFA